MRALLNLFWLLLSGIWPALGYALAGLVMCLTVIGIPLGSGNFKLALVALAPVGKEIVSVRDPRAVNGVVSF